MNLNLEKRVRAQLVRIIMGSFMMFLLFVGLGFSYFRDGAGFVAMKNFDGQIPNLKISHYAPHVEDITISAPSVLGEATQRATDDEIREFEELGKTPRFSVKFAETKSAGRLRYGTIDPGTSINDAIILNLLDNVPTLFRLDFRDSRGRAIAKSIGEDVGLRDLSLESWIEFPDGKDVFLDGRGRDNVPFKINVPEGVGPGDYEGTLMASILDFGGEILDAVETEGLDAARESVGVGAQITIAVGLDVLIRVAGDLIPNLYFADLGHQIIRSEGLTLDLDYENNGNASVVPIAKVTITDMFGNNLFNNEYLFRLISPGQSANTQVRIPLEDFNPSAFGVNTVEVELTYNFYNLAVDAKQRADSFYTSGVAVLRLYSLPWPLIWILGLIIFLILVVFLYRSCFLFMLNRSGKIYIVKQGDSLQTLSDKFLVNPKEIMLVNHLKAPYFLQKGSQLIIPRQVKKKK